MQYAVVSVVGQAGSSVASPIRSDRGRVCISGELAIVRHGKISLQEAGVCPASDGLVHVLLSDQIP